MMFIMGLSKMLLGLFSFIIIVGGLALHLLTMYLYYLDFSFFYAIVAFFLPVISQLYLAFTITSEVGFLNNYNLLIFVYVLCYIASFIFTAVHGFAFNRIERRYG